MYGSFAAACRFSFLFLFFFPSPLPGFQIEEEQDRARHYGLRRVEGQIKQLHRKENSVKQATRDRGPGGTGYNRGKGHTRVRVNTPHGSPKHKRLKERFLLGRNRTKRAHFRGSPLFQSAYNIKQNKHLIQLILCQLDVGGWQMENGTRLTRAVSQSVSQSASCPLVYSVAKGQYVRCRLLLGNETSERGYTRWTVRLNRLHKVDGQVKQATQ